MSCADMTSEPSSFPTFTHMIRRPPLSRVWEYRSDPLRPRLRLVNCRAGLGHSLLSASAWLHLRAAFGLSSREMQIAQGMFDDQKEDAIAAEIGISPHTVNTYVQRLYRKLDVCSRVQLIVCLMAAHLALSTADSNRTDAAAAEPALGVGRARSAPASSRA
jgi:DNA-binding CsgD family transcriptional regulator